MRHRRGVSVRLGADDDPRTVDSSGWDVTVTDACSDTETVCDGHSLQWKSLRARGSRGQR
eukprot:3192307-Rhodomonas_salina.3